MSVLKVLTKDQLAVVADGLINLISDKRQLEDNDLGICWNLRHITNLYLSDYDGGCHVSYALVSENCHDWAGYSGSIDYPVPFDDWNAKMWEGDQLKARISLMNHLLAKVNSAIDELGAD